jgi:sphingolipid 4-desaturase/C4-monooxygenase
MQPDNALSFIRVDYKEPHLERTRKLLAAHPEVRSLFGHTPITAVFVVTLVALQVVLAWALQSSPWWLILLASWTVGAVANHALWVLIHECTHNLVFRSAWANSWLQIFANLPIIFPAAISFRKYHLLHHRFQGDPSLDADLASEGEARLVGNGLFGKAFWQFFFFAFQAARVRKLSRIAFFDRWYLANLACQVAFIGLVLWLLAPGAMVYLLLASMFSIGLHPLGARWIQEHYIVHEKQETYSYYGPLNLVAFNVGYHNEHHDLMRVPWMKLPQVKALAPEFYENLHAHHSWTRLWLRFLFDRKLSLYSRVTRPDAYTTAQTESMAPAEAEARALA